jgi:dTDP-4-dehydrorhamnose reductase
MRVLIAGAAGMLGQDVAGAAERRGHETFGLTRNELDITDPAAIDDAIAEVRPEAVIDCAAWSDVDGADD